MSGCDSPITMLTSLISITPSLSVTLSFFRSFFPSSLPLSNEKTERQPNHEMCHLTELDTFKLEPIIQVSLALFLLNTAGRAGCVCVGGFTNNLTSFPASFVKSQKVQFI